MAEAPGQYAKLNDINMYYEIHGAGEPLVLIHGGTVNGKRMWEPHLSSFSQHFRVIVPDSRGHGRTDNPAGKFSYRMMAEDVAALVNTLRLRRPFICGYSDGGQIALELGMRHPDLARALVVGGATNRLPESFLASLKGMGLEAPGVVDLEKFAKEAPRLVERLKEVHAPQGPDYWKRYLQQISMLWLTPLGYVAADYAKVSVPTLLLLGDRDDGVPLEEALEMYRLIPKVELAIVPNSDHHFPWSKPELFMAPVLDFLRRHAGPPPQGA